MSNTSLSNLNIEGIRFYEPGASARSKSDGTSTSDIRNDFLKLLTVQLQNQDPLNPLESAEMTSQLAQLNMVDSLNQMNSNMTSLITQMQLSQFMSQSQSIGAFALAKSTSVEYEGQGSVAMGVQFDKPVNGAKARIVDTSGNVISENDLGNLKGGISNFVWDGKDLQGQQARPGLYRLEVIANDVGGSEIRGQTLVASMVAAVGRSDKDLVLTLLDGRKIAPTDVQQWVVN